MATLRWAEICDYVIEGAHGKIGLIGLFDTLFAPSFPAVHPDFWVACKMEGSPNEAVALEMDIVAPDGELMAHLGPLQGKIGRGGHHYLVGRIMAPNFEKPGRYEIRIRPHGAPSHTITLWLRQKPE